MFNFQEVDPRLGTWEDVQGLADKLDLELELMVNHVSPASAEFQDFLQAGDASQYADMFIDWDRFWPDGERVRVFKELSSQTAQRSCGAGRMHVRNAVFYSKMRRGCGENGTSK